MEPGAQRMELHKFTWGIQFPFWHAWAEINRFGWNDINTLSILTLLIWSTFYETTITGTTYDSNNTSIFTGLALISVTDVFSINCVCTERRIVQKWEKVPTRTVFWRWARWPTSWRSLILINSTWRNYWRTDLKLDSVSGSSWGQNSDHQGKGEKYCFRHFSFYYKA